MDREQYYTKEEISSQVSLLMAFKHRVNLFGQMERGTKVSGATKK